MEKKTLIDSFLRSKYQTLCIDPVLKHALVIRLHPQSVTIAACFFGLLFCPLLLLELNWAALAALVFSGYLDTLDGSLARQRKLSSPKGAVLDILCDRFVEFSTLLGLFLVAPDTRALPCLLMLGSILLCVTSFLVVGIFTGNESEKSFHYSPGIIERTEAFIFFIAMTLWPALFTALGYLFAGLVFLTAILRAYQFLKS